MNLIIAWRNIGRNKKRSLITVSSVVLAIVLAVFTRSFQEGSYAKMIENAVGKFTGYVQVHQKDYWNDKMLDNGMEISDSLKNTILSVKQVEGINYRLESFSLASFKNSTKGTLIMGVDPLEEDKMLGLKSKLTAGEYLSATDNSILLGSKLAKYLKISVGDTLVLLGQGHWGQSAVGAYPVKGIVKMPAPDIDRQIVFMPLLLARDYFSFPNGLTSIVVKFKDSDYTQAICDELNSKLDTAQYTAMAWQEMSPEMVQVIHSDRVGGILMISILYMIIAFGILGTVLMMTEERKKEFSVMVAIGMQKSKLVFVTLYETILMNAMGIVIGLALAFPLVVYFNFNPITMTGAEAESMAKLGVEPVLPTLISFKIFAKQISIILIITGIAAIYPAFSIFKMKVLKSLRR